MTRQPVDLPPHDRVDRRFGSPPFDAAMAMAALLVVIVALLSRIAVFGNPVVHIDEEFYRLVGDRMLTGSIPYVDIWDRKPIGLFLIFAGLRLVAGGRLWIDNAIAVVAVAATAMVIFAIARRIAGVAGGIASAIVYVLMLDLAGGEACQAPVWYNLPVAIAVAILFFARTGERRLTGDFRAPGMAAMALFGIAMQIKYNAVFEGLFVGLGFIVASRGAGRGPARLAVDAALWIGCALLPTILAAASYAAMGHWHEWLFANFVSILERGHEPVAIVRRRIVDLLILTVPLVATMPLRRLVGWQPASDAVRRDVAFVDVWAGCALLGVVVFGTWYNHYALPLFVPLSVVAAPLAGRKPGRLYLAILIGFSAYWGQHILQRHVAMRGDARMLARVTDDLAGHRGCIFVYDGLVAAYESTRSCLPTAHVFPNHFAGRSERGATGIVQEQEVRAIMARRPDRVTAEEPAYPNENPAPRAIVYAALRSDYRVLDRIVRGDRTLVIYGLKSRL